MRYGILLLATLLILPGMSLQGQQVYHNCGMAGDATAAGLKALNRLKNRDQAPVASDSSITLSAIAAPGDDRTRWSDSAGAEIVGFVFDVKKGGRESCNCHAKNALYRDTHIELLLDPMNSGGAHRVIVEVTPRWRAKMKAQGIDWSTSALRARLLGRWVKVRGWMVFDEEHAAEAENTNAGRPRNWRATAWEIHPVCSIEVVSGPN